MPGGLEHPESPATLASKGEFRFILLVTLLRSTKQILIADIAVFLTVWGTNSALTIRLLLPSSPSSLPPAISAQGSASVHD